MTDDLLAAAKAEERRLQTELDSHPTYRKLLAVRALIELYIGLPAVAQHASVSLVTRSAETVASPVALPTERRMAVPREGTKTAKVGTAAENYLRRIGRRAQSPEIVRALEAEGFEFKGQRPINALASALSHNPLFDNVLGQGYGLKEWSEQPSLERAPDRHLTSADHEIATNRTDSSATRDDTVDTQLNLAEVQSANGS